MAVTDGNAASFFYWETDRASSAETEAAVSFVFLWSAVRNGDLSIRLVEYCSYLSYFSYGGMGRL